MGGSLYPMIFWHNINTGLCSCCALMTEPVYIAVTEGCDATDCSNLIKIAFVSSQFHFVHGYLDSLQLVEVVLDGDYNAICHWVTGHLTSPDLEG